MSGERVQAIREAIIEALPADTSPHGEVPEPRHVYAPPSHLKTLRLECSLVIGARGVGKTFWSSALRSEPIRHMLGTSVPDFLRIDVGTGYGERPDLDAYPDADVFDSLLSRGMEAYAIWRAVIGRWLAVLLSEEIPRQSWPDTVDWVSREPESFGRLLQRANERFQLEQKHGLIVFDALDRSSQDWRRMDIIVRDLLRVILLLKRFPYLHGKVFLREDQFEGRPVTDFPDASKLLATRVELTWAPHDLHGLLWQYLCNGLEDHGGNALRRIYEDTLSSSPDDLIFIIALVNSPSSPDHIVKIGDVWTLSDVVKRHEGKQRFLFSALAGEWMGRDRRRGIPYFWSVGHLADGRGRTSPRSFLAAIRAAAEESRDRYPDHPLPLHYESIKRGVQKASEIRVSELAEDYPWVRKLMEPLRGLTVPCSFDLVVERWREKFGETPATIKFDKLPPEHHEEGWNGLRKDLSSLGIFESMRDDRVNMPDLYRVAFGLGRRGGVKPVARIAPE